jgi:redox-sensitive bicupin YhaK (pirin superfamily)
MIERRPYDKLQSEDLGWLKARHHLFADGLSSWGCMRAWNDEEIAPNAGFRLETHANIEIITYVREGTLTHRDGLGNDSIVEAGNVQVLSAGTGIRHSEYNLEQAPVRIFRIWLEPASQGGSPAWGMQPCPTAAGSSGCFAVLASSNESDHDALPIRAWARVLNAKLKVGQSIEYVLAERRLAYLVPSAAIDVNGVKIHARDGTAIKDVAVLRIVAIEDADVLMVDALQASTRKPIVLRGK